MTYCELMAKATELRERAESDVHYGLTPMAIRKVLAEFDALVEKAYEVGDNEGFLRGHEEGESLGKAQVDCHRTKDEEWEANLA